MESAQTELVSSVKTQLRPDDVICFVSPVKRLISGIEISRAVALVRHEPTNEQAFFIFAKVDSAMLIELVLPIYEDTRFTARGDTVCELQTPSRQLNCIVNFPSEQVQSAKSILSAIEVAKQEGHSLGKSHKWVEPYEGPSPSGHSDGEASRPKGEGDRQVELYFRSREHTDEVKNPLVSFAQQSNGGEYDPSKFMSVKEVWVAGQMKEREAEFTTVKTTTVFLGTWNVNGKKPEEPLDEWLLASSVVPDIVAVGFQELDLSAEALFLGDTGRSQPWEEAIIRTLSKRHKYSMVLSRQLVGMLLVLCVKEELVKDISEVMSVVAGVGIMGMMGNKGGVAIRFKFCDSTICIVNSHLNAHFDRVERRNQDYQDLCRRLIFNNEFDIFSHDHLLWIGDLNYRLDCENEEVRKRITNKDWSHLFTFDQLQQQMKKGLAFDCFTEGEINFAPTYKYDTNSDIYDTSEKGRTPSWCDRVLWKGKNIKQLSYNRHELISSDHRPVSSLMELQVKSIISSQRNQVYQDIVKRLDKMENECMPDADVSSNNVEFTDVTYFVPSHQHITVTNTSMVVVRFRFIPKLDQTNFSKPWLDVRPPYGMIMPGEKVDIRLTVFIDNAWAPDFNFGREKFEDILILHLEKGKDYFVAVSGNYLKSSFGNSLEHLICYPGPVRFSDDEVKVQNAEKLSVPKELWRIVDYIYKRGMDEPGLFMESGSQTEMDQIRELLDTGGSFDLYVGSIHSMAEVLIQFLDSLAEPVIPTSLYRQCLEASSSYSQCKQLLSYLPTVHYNVFYYLMAFLREVLAHASKNKLKADQAALLFSSVIIRRSHCVNKKAKLVSEETRTRKAEFVQHFLSSKERLKVP